MSEISQLISNYNRIRDRLRYPSNAVPDDGIDLKRKRIPKVLGCPVDKSAVFCSVTIMESVRPAHERVGLKLVDIERAVCEHFKLTETNLHSRRRTKEHVYPRHILWYLACKHTTLSLPMIGRKHHYDHTTILHAKRRIAEMILVDSRTVTIVNKIESMLFGEDAKADQPHAAVATISERPVAEKLEVSLPQLEIRQMD